MKAALRNPREQGSSGDFFASSPLYTACVAPPVTSDLRGLSAWHMNSFGRQCQAIVPDALNLAPAVGISMGKVTGFDDPSAMLVNGGRKLVYPGYPATGVVFDGAVKELVTGELVGDQSSIPIVPQLGGEKLGERQVPYLTRYQGLTGDVAQAGESNNATYPQLIANPTGPVQGVPKKAIVMPAAEEITSGEVLPFEAQGRRRFPVDLVGAKYATVESQSHDAIYEQMDSLNASSGDSLVHIRERRDDDKSRFGQYRR